MSLTCEIQQPSRSSTKIRINGHEPYNEGSTDNIEITFEDQKIPNITITPQISANRRRTIRFNRPNVNIINNDNQNFISENNFNNNLIGNDVVKDTTDTDISVQNQLLDVSNANSSYPIGFNRRSLIDDTYLNKNNFFQDRSLSRSDYKPTDIVSFKESDIINLTTNDNLNYEIIFNNLDIESSNGKIEPFVLRDLGSNQIPADFPVKIIKAEAGHKDVRNRNFLSDVYDNNSKLEFFEECIDVFTNLQTVVLKQFTNNAGTIKDNGKFKEISYNTTSVNSNKIHRPRILDMSWISYDNTNIKPFIERNKTIFDDIRLIDNINIKSLSLLNYTNTNSTQEKEKLGQKKLSSGYDVDYSKSICGIESIAFLDLTE